MTAYSVADAKNSLPKLIDRALKGEEVIITRHAKPVAELRPVAPRPGNAAGTYTWLQKRRSIMEQVQPDMQHLKPQRWQ